jgi:putative tricarboxylic transport membrane protein
MARRDRISSLVILSLSIFVCVESVRLPVGIGTWNDPGPGFFPFAAGIIMAALSSGLYIKSLRSKIPEMGSWYVKAKWKKLFLILICLVGYAIFLEIIGFMLSTFILLFFLFRFVEDQRWIVAIGGSLAVALISYAIFARWLMLQLPKGFWGF